MTRSLNHRAGARIMLTLGVWLGLVGCHGNREAPPTTTVEAVFSVPSMHCAACVVTVRTAAKGVDGVYDARADLDRKMAWVRYDPRRTNPEAIARAITDAGYPANPVADKTVSATPPR